MCYILFCCIARSVGFCGGLGVFSRDNRCKSLILNVLNLKIPPPRFFGGGILPNTPIYCAANIHTIYILCNEIAIFLKNWAECS